MHKNDKTIVFIGLLIVSNVALSFVIEKHSKISTAVSVETIVVTEHHEGKLGSRLTKQEKIKVIYAAESKKFAKIVNKDHYFSNPILISYFPLFPSISTFGIKNDNYKKLCLILLAAYIISVFIYIKSKNQFESESCKKKRRVSNKTLQHDE